MWHYFANRPEFVSSSHAMNLHGNIALIYLAVVRDTEKSAYIH